MNMNEIKQKISIERGLKMPISNLAMVRQLDPETKEKEPWLSAWVEEEITNNRIRVVAPDEVFQQIMESKGAKNDLAVKYELVPEDITKNEKGEDVVRKAYHRYVIITPQNIEGMI